MEEITLISSDRIYSRIVELARDISNYCKANCISELNVIWAAEGAIMFAADLCRKLNVPYVRISSVKISTYQDSTKPTGNVKVERLSGVFAGKDILLIDDILETGNTMKIMENLLLDAGAKSVKKCVLLKKKNVSNPVCQADYVGFEIDDYFVYGYGLDYQNMYRNFPDIKARILNP